MKTGFLFTVGIVFCHGAVWVFFFFYRKPFCKTSKQTPLLSSVYNTDHVNPVFLAWINHFVAASQCYLCAVRCKLNFWIFISVTGPLSELQIAYVCRETLQVLYFCRCTRKCLFHVNKVDTENQLSSSTSVGNQAETNEPG